MDSMRRAKDIASMNLSSCVDPYARAVAGLIKWSDEMFAYALGKQDGDLTKDTGDNAAGLPKSVVVSDDFDWGGDKSPDVPLSGIGDL